MVAKFFCQSKSIAWEYFLKKCCSIYAIFSKGVAYEFDASLFCMLRCTQSSVEFYLKSLHSIL